ncbi:MAG: MBL fold metallo-hydrolase [Candidatus Acidiferrales bacterium]
MMLRKVTVIFVNVICACLISSVGFAQDAAAPAALPFTLHEVGSGVWAAIAVPQGKAGSNAGFVIGSDSVAVVDTFVTADAAKALLAEIRKKTNLPVRFVVNTHYHLDHTAGNGVFAEAGATLVAQRNVEAWLRTENLKFFGPNPKPEQKARVESLALPQVVYDRGVDLFLGTRRISVRFQPGHTGGDSVVVVPDANVVFCGDLFWKHTLPNLIDATTSDWIGTLDRVTQAEPSATFIPGHGEVGKVADVEQFRDYLAALRKAVGDAQASGKSGDPLVEAALPVMKEKYGDWNFFDHFSKPNIEQTAAELKGQKKIPVAAENWFTFGASN